MLNIVECKGLVKRYSSKTALNLQNISIPAGKIVGLLGPNGSGKTTFIKILAGLLTPSEGTALIDGMPIGVETKKIVSYLPERTYLDETMRVISAIEMFESFYSNFNVDKAMNMLNDFGINPKSKIKTLSKGTKEKVQLMLVMSREAKLYLLDEPISGVDPAARDYILKTIIENYNPSAAIIIATHLVSDIERILDGFIFIKDSKLLKYDTVDNVRNETNMSIDALFREMFKC